MHCAPQAWESVRWDCRQRCDGPTVPIEGVMAMVTLVLCVLAVCLVIGAAVWLLTIRQKSNTLEQELGVRPVYEQRHLPGERIRAYCELKQRIARQHSVNEGNELWMSDLPTQAKEVLKYHLMQRAIGDMSALHKVDADARGYSKLFMKGVITRRFWTSVLDAEHELTQELDLVRHEAACIEPTQDPQGIINEAMHFVMRYGDKFENTNDAVGDMMRHLPRPPQGAAGPPAPAGPLPSLGPMGPMGPMAPPGGMPHPMAMPPMPHPRNALPQAGGGDESCNWKQDVEEVEVTVSVPNNATKTEVKVVIHKQALKVEHLGKPVAEGRLGGVCAPEGSTWTFGRGHVVITLEKADPRPWPSLFLAED